MENTETHNKLYYSISEVAEKFNVNTSLIRFWEKEFSSYLKPKKNRNGKRMFTAADIQNLETIYELTKNKGFTLAGARTFLKNNRRNKEAATDISDVLNNVRIKLIQLQKELNSGENVS